MLSFERALEIAPLSALVVGEGRVSWANMEAERLFGLDLRTRHVEDLIEGPGDLCEAVTSEGRIPVEVNRLEVDSRNTIIFLHDRRYLRDLQSEVAEGRHFLQLIREAYQPDQLGSIEGMRLGVWSQQASRLGGDFIDLISLGDRGKALVLADGSGVGGAAWVIASAARRYLRAYLLSETSVAEALRWANDALFSEFSPTRFVTCIVALIRPMSLTIELASAGHPEPVWISGGRARTVPLPRGPALGVAPGQQYESRPLTLTANDGLVFFSDGLTEHRNREGQYFGTEGIANTVALAIDEHNAIRTIRAAAQRFGQAFVDDVALAALWAGPPPAPAMNIHFPPEPTRVRAVRHAIECALKQAGLSDDEAGDMILAAGEALNNAVEHGPVPGKDSTVEVYCRIYPNMVIIEVKSRKTDWSAPKRPAGGFPRGYGLHVMRTLADHFEVRQEPEGTIVTLMKHRRSC